MTTYTKKTNNSRFRNSTSCSSDHVPDYVPAA